MNNEKSVVLRVEVVDYREHKHLLDFIQTRTIEDVVIIQEEEVGEIYPGELNAGGLFESINLLVKSLTDPLTELVKCLQEYVKLFRTEITIHTASGTKIEVKGKENPKDLADHLAKLLYSIEKGDQPTEK